MTTVSTIDLYINGTKIATPEFVQTANNGDVWEVNTQAVYLRKGSNIIAVSYTHLDVYKRQELHKLIYHVIMGTIPHIKIIIIMVEKFKEFLVISNMAKNTVSAYIYAVNEFHSKHKSVKKNELLLYKTYLIETFKPKTVNLRIQALNKYLEFLGKSDLRLKSVKVQQRSYLENVISNADYTFLKKDVYKRQGCEGKGRIHSSNDGRNNNETNKSAALFDTFIYNYF